MVLWFSTVWRLERMVEPLAALGMATRAVELPSYVPAPGASGEATGDMYADAAAGQENVRHLVYVASVMPEFGETLAGLGGGGGAGPWMDPRPEGGTMGVKAELLAEAFMQDCDEAAVAGALERLTRQPLAVFGQAPRAVAWREKPSTYVVCAEDRATPPEAQRGYARRAGKEPRPRTGCTASLQESVRDVANHRPSEQS